jgi:surfactin family lipopeptide synthetase A/fengycin family lipopeptide synthetase D
MTLLAAVNVLFYWYTGQQDIVIGTPAAGREHMDLENQIGFYLNTLPLRTTFSGDDSFERLLDRVKTITLNAYEHQLYPFNLLVGELNAKPDASRSPLFDVVVQVLNFNLNINQYNQLKLQDITTEPYEIETAESKYDLTFNFWELPAGTGTISAILIYNSDLFKHEAMVRMVNRFQELIQKILNNTIASLSDLCVETNIKIPTIKPISRQKPNPQSPGNKEKI